MSVFPEARYLDKSGIERRINVGRAPDGRTIIEIGKENIMLTQEQGIRFGTLLLKLSGVSVDVNPSLKVASLS